MEEIEEERQVRHWLKENGISDQHQQMLIDLDKIAKDCWSDGDQVVMPEYTVGNMRYSRVGMVICDERLDEAIDLVKRGEEKHLAAFQDFQRIKKTISDELEMVDFARLMKPFAVGDDFEGYKAALSMQVQSGQLEVEYFPWQNRYIQFLLLKPNFTSQKERRRYYSEIPWEYQERAVISLEGVVKQGNATPVVRFGIHPSAAAKVWRSYLSPPEPAPAPPPQKDPNNSKAPALLEACISAWNSDVRNNNINPTDAKALFIYASDRGVKGYEGLKVDFREKYSVRVIRWDWDSVYWKHFVTAFKGRPV